ncbi:hypothetical protein B0H66DRAFT_629527 [Apodospora peruviana]|uniref:Ig-like domain-containing protein n=1 Tax=Apodospora peruviana TaxID=516989 RepID=A0AAE0HVC7_9PEZI|nr:hypothetical protein B0H66DRAFT_629527 [Apodospora peruviana]
MVTARISLLAASATVLATVSAQGPPAADLSSGCTSKSFTIPSWLINGVKATSNDVFFQIANRATNYTAELACKLGNSTWSDCSTKSEAGLKASVQVTGSKLQVLVNQTWTCDDRATPLTFTAVGNNSRALNSTSSLLVKGSLLAPVAITPSYLDGPTGHDSPGCTAISEKPSWILSNILFTDQTGDGKTSQPFQMFNLLLTNPANGYQASCMPGTSYEYSNDLSTLVCAGNEFQATNVGQFPISTTAWFDVKTKTFTVRQTWFCDDTDPGRPLNITATGSAVIPFECSTDAVPDSPDDTKTTCQTKDNTDVTVHGRLGPVVTLQPFVIEDPVPSRDGCTLTSMFHPAWAFSSFSVTTANATGGLPELFFNLILATDSRGFQFPIPIYQGDKVAGQEGWYKCVVGTDGENAAPLWPYECSFKYVAERKELTLKADWACQEFDPDHPILFSGVTTTTVNTPLVCENFMGETQCTAEDGAYTWTAPISNKRV